RVSLSFDTAPTGPRVPLSGGSSWRALKFSKVEGSPYLADCEEPPALAPERANPVQLASANKSLRLLAQYRGRACPRVLDAILGRPRLHLGERVTVFPGMLRLITEPHLLPRRSLFRARALRGNSGGRRGERTLQTIRALSTSAT